MTRWNCHRASWTMRAALALTAALGLAATASAQPQKKDSAAFLIPPEAQVSASVSPARVAPGGRVEYRVTVRLAPHWHIYAYTPEQPAEGPRSTQFDLFETGGLVPANADWASNRPADEKPEPAFDNQVFGSFEDEVTWTRVLQVPADHPGGKVSLQAQIYFQICDPNGCRPPVRKTLAPVSLEIEAGRAAVTPGDPAAAPETPAGATAASVAPAEVSPVPAVPASRDPAVKSAAAVPAAATPAASPSSANVQSKIQEGLIPFLLFSALGGLAALAMPCVWPMVPVTVNFFVKQGQSRNGNAKALAITYCLAIITIFTLVGVLFSAFMKKASSIQNLANNGVLNLFVAGVFLIFGLSLLGLFEIRLPSFLLNASSRGESRGGLIGVMFMALTLTITSFTCTFPVVGGLLGIAARGSYLYPVLGLATFATVLALPFFMLALAPGLLQKIPRSGDWMNTVKVVGGLVEIGAAFKFLNTAEIGFGRLPQEAWIDAQVVLASWVVLSAVCGIYLLGMFRTHDDHESARVGPIRLLSGSLFLFVALYLSPPLFGVTQPSTAFNRLVVGLLPPDFSEDMAARGLLAGGAGGAAQELYVKATSTDPDEAQRQEKLFHGVQWGMSYKQALETAQQENRPVLIDFTGVNCANCRLMEAEVLPRPEITSLLSEFVTVAQYTDRVPIASLSEDERERLVEANQILQNRLVGDATTPLYVVLTPGGEVVDYRGGYIPAKQFKAFLEEALSRARALKPSMARAG